MGDRAMFTPEQIVELNKPLDKAKVKQRDKGNVKLDYIESWHAIAEANRIFNFDWSRETIYCKEISRIECKIGKGDWQKDGFKVGYEAKVRVQVGDIVKEGTGHGSGTMTDLFDCIESAAKEAESDAMKRALMMFGNSFGLALYDKEKKGVEDVSAKPVKKPEPKPEPKEETPADVADRLIVAVKKQQSALKLVDWERLQVVIDARDKLFLDAPELSKKVDDAIKQRFEGLATVA